MEEVGGEFGDEQPGSVDEEGVEDGEGSVQESGKGESGADHFMSHLMGHLRDDKSEIWK